MKKLLDKEQRDYIANIIAKIVVYIFTIAAVGNFVLKSSRDFKNLWLILLIGSITFLIGVLLKPQVV